ncbi:glutamate--tRNA ligase GUS1 [Ascoidea rubescens DSM 1968]|uniref:glutamate--tRNA ligase n=1 Tax=Ascoidea rubescens DSM 1968 TaxID=1344418 RepID=A0A1D2V9K5_9ASCO|nr:glutamyl-tRNA synthetase [Ascoidea rubescens DSM 1968]ODV58259.1 glutamyl-tRNA synthetase [Ascoidea rubescens DSM 1968]
MSCTIAVKADVVAYPTFLALGLIPDSSIKVDFVEKISNSSKISLLLNNENDIKIDDIKSSLIYISSLFPDYFKFDSIIENWVDFALANLIKKNFNDLSKDLITLNNHLNLRTYVIDYSISLADLAIFGIIKSNPILLSIIKSGNYINITRWFNLIDSIASIQSSITQFNGFKLLNSNKNKGKGKKSASASNNGNNNSSKKTHKANFNIDLKDAQDGKVVTRFPPEPSGYLHIGHAKAAILNKYFADMYHGKLIIRFDDTNPAKEKMEYQDSIIEDLQLLGIKGDRLTFSSDYFDEMYNLAINMIKENKAYCDDTPLETMRAERMDGIKSKRRDASVEENLDIFTNEMKNATEKGLTYCLRAKISYDIPNKALRDPVIYRCNLIPHHRTGTQWKMYPTYDFCVPVVDSIEGVTHALRTIEYRDRNPQYVWMQEALHLRPVHIWDFARVNFVRTLLSKRKLQWFVDKKYVSNWDDPRFPTVRGVRRRGMTVKGLTDFVISQGPSKNIINLDWSSIWAFNKKVIDPIAPRHTAVFKKDACLISLSDGPTEKTIEKRPKHKKNPDVGEKDVIYTSSLLIDQDDALAIATDGDKEITLMDWGNIVIVNVVKDETSEVVKEIQGKLNLQGDFRKTKKKITWLANTDDKVELDLVDFDHLITKDKLDEGDNFEDFLTPKTEFHTPAYGDVNVSQMKEGDIIQFERKGYYRLDKAATESSPAVFFTVPDGKTVSKYGNKK